MSKFNFSTLLVALVLSGCASKSVFVTYNAPQEAAADWFPIPSDAPGSVEVAEIDVPRLESVITENVANAPVTALTVIEMENSLGYSSLRLNRTPALSWEITETALKNIGYKVIDLDRENYRFVLGSTSTNETLWTALFSPKKDFLNIDIVPQGLESLVLVEGDGNSLPDAGQAESIIRELKGYFLKQG